MIDVYFEDRIEILVAEGELDEVKVREVLEANGVGVSKITRS